MIPEEALELTCLDWLERQGIPSGTGTQYLDDRDGQLDRALLHRRLEAALHRLNPHIPSEALKEATRRLQRADQPTLLARNQQLHHWITQGIKVQHRTPEGALKTATVRLVDFDDPAANDWLALRQFILKGQQTKRPDVVLFLNGLPLVVFELKKPGETLLRSAYDQLEDYKQVVPALFETNAFLVVADGLDARLGSLTSGWERFMRWRSINGDKGEERINDQLPDLEVLIEGLFDKQRFLDFLRYYILFEHRDKGQPIKKIAAYHQFHAIQRAVGQTLRATGLSKDRIPPTGYERADQLPEDGDKRVGVVWHTQGSGKSLSMVFYAGRVMVHPLMKSPTLVILTDRNDLDGQLFATFSACQDVLGDLPTQAESRADLRVQLKRAQGGIIFTTVHKFLHPEGGKDDLLLSDRDNIVVVADEAHRSQYDFIDGYAAAMRAALPNASFLGFTGTPVASEDKNTRQVFGEYVHVYDIQRAVDDGATVPIYYESRFSRLKLNEEILTQLEPVLAEEMEGDDEEAKDSVRKKWTTLAQVVGADARLEELADDILEHFDRRVEAMVGKAMVVCMTREICVRLYDKIVARRPEWGSNDDEKGAVKVVMSGSTSSDPKEFHPHLRSKSRQDAIANRVRDASDPLQIVIVQGMWLTGFDAPSLHTLYIDKPMKGHNLMQAIARVNRVFGDKPGGLVVDYIGLANELEDALKQYTSSGGEGLSYQEQTRAIEELKQAHAECCAYLNDSDWEDYLKETNTNEDRLKTIKRVQNHILAQPDGKQDWRTLVLRLEKAFALSVPDEFALSIREEVGFFQMIRNQLREERTGGGKEAGERITQAIRSLISKAIESEEPRSLIEVSGVDGPRVDILSDDVLEHLASLLEKNLAVEALERLITNQIRSKLKTNVVQMRLFGDRFRETISRYHSRMVDATQVIEELIQIAKEIREHTQRGVDLGLSGDEMSFYDALAENQSARDILGNEALTAIAKILIARLRQNLTIDWMERESSRAQIIVMVKRILREHNYPPDLEKRATQLVLEQAERVCIDWL